jgi:hypothetical protein
MHKYGESKMTRIRWQLYLYVISGSDLEKTTDGFLCVGVYICQY